MGRTLNMENSPATGTSPSVMLSPNARIVVTASRGDGSATLTANEQLAYRRTASVATHMTAVEPTLNVEPLGGVHVADTGAVPPVSVGEP
jgi:hypothetical protein